MSQRLLVLIRHVSAASIQGAGQAGGAERYVAQPAGGGQLSSDVEGEVVDLAALQCVAGVVLVGLVPGQDASFMLRSCWTRARCVKAQIFFEETQSSRYFLNCSAHQRSL